MNLLYRLVTTPLHSLIVASFYVLSRVMYSVKIAGVENFTRRPSTIVLMSHKRDIDGGLVSTVLCWGRGVFSTNIHLHYLLRDDLFRPGFFSKHLLRSAPSPVRRVLRTVNIGGGARLFRLTPIIFLPERTVCDTLLDLKSSMGARRLDEVLSDRFLASLGQWARESEAGKAQMTVEDVMRWPIWRALQQKWNPRFYRPEALATLKVLLRDQIDRQVDDLARLLDSGESLLIAPEGMLTPNGSIGHVQRGLGEILRRVNVNVRLLPVCVTYDWMTRGRKVAFAEVGQEIEEAKQLSAKELESLVRGRLCSLGTVTMGNLASAYLMSMDPGNDGHVSMEDTRRRLFAAARSLADSGRKVDPRLLEWSRYQQRFDAFLDFCLKKDTAIAEHGRNRDGRLTSTVAARADVKALDYGRREFEDVAPQYSFEPAPSLQTKV